jgi:aldose 1-epimerase
MDNPKCRDYGVTPDGQKIYCYRLENKKGMYAEVTNLGGVIRALGFPDKEGRPGDIVMGHDSFENQMTKFGFTGALMGRVVNRIWGGEINIHGKVIQLEKNFGNMTFHGGKGMYAMKLFYPRAYEDAEGDKLELYYKDTGEGGFPGEVDVWVTFIVTPQNELKIRYRALPTEDTILNITHHAYFNLGGHGSGTIKDQILQMDADFFTPVNDDGVPSGEVRSVVGTAFDFRKGRPFREGIESTEEQIVKQHGYDMNLCLAGYGLRKVARAWDPKSGRVMTVSTDMPGVQLYTASNEREDTGFKEGATYHQYDAFCLETQYFPNGTAFSHFPSPVFPAKTLWTSETIFALSLE